MPLTTNEAIFLSSSTTKIRIRLPKLNCCLHSCARWDATSNEYPVAAMKKKLRGVAFKNVMSVKGNGNITSLSLIATIKSLDTLKDETADQTLFQLSNVNFGRAPGRPE